MGAWNWLDWTFAVIVALSMVAAIRKGFVHELVSLAALVLGIVVAAMAYPRASLWFEDLTKSHEIALGLGFLTLFSGTLLLGSLVSLLARKVIKSAGIQWFDRFLGAVFGLVRGVLVDCVSAPYSSLLSPSNRKPCSSHLWLPTLRRERTLFPWLCPKTSNRNFAWGLRNSEIR